MLKLAIHLHIHQGFPGGSDGEEPGCNAGDLSPIPRLGRSPGEGNGLPTPVFLPGEFHGQKLYLSLLYLNKTLLHKSSEQSSLVTGPGSNSPPPEAKNGVVRCS